MVDGLLLVGVGLVTPARRLRGAAPVDGLAVHDGQQPGDRAPLGRVEASGMTPALEIGLLRDLLGLRPGAEHPYGEAERARRGGVVPLGERPLVASAGSLEQLGE